MNPRLRLLLTIIASMAATTCLAPEDDFSSTWPQWQRIEFDSVPSAWLVEEASFAFDAWEATVQVTVTPQEHVAILRFSDDEGRSLEAGVPPLPPRLALPESQPVRLTVISRQGFEGIARGLTVRDTTGAALFVYDDGGYGPAFYEAPERAGIEVLRDLTGPGSRDAWETRAVTFRFEDASVTLNEGADGPLGSTGLRAYVVVSREWTGAPPTDVDLTPLAYFVYRVAGPRDSGG